MSYCGSVPPVLPLCFINLWHGLVKSYQNHKLLKKACQFYCFSWKTGDKTIGKEFMLSLHKQNTLIPGKNISPCCELSMAELQKQSIKFDIESNGTHCKTRTRTASIVLWRTARTIQEKPMTNPLCKAVHYEPANIIPQKVWQVRKTCTDSGQQTLWGKQNQHHIESTTWRSLVGLARMRSVC